MINNRDLNFDQNNRDYDFGHNRAALVPTNAAYLLLYFMEFEATTKVREQLHNTDKMLYLARA